MSPVVNADWLREICLSFPGTTEQIQWGNDLLFKVAGKMFLIVGLDGALADGVTFKCTPDEFDDLTDIDGIAQAPYCAKRHWVHVSDLDALPTAEFQRRIRRSCDLVVEGLTKKLRRELGL